MPKRGRERDDTPLGPLTGAQIEALSRRSPGRPPLQVQNPPPTPTLHQLQQHKETLVGTPFGAPPPTAAGRGC